MSRRSPPDLPPLPKYLQDRIDADALREAGREAEECPSSSGFSISIGGPPWFDEGPSLRAYVWGAASFVSTALCAYHGYRRNGTVSDGILWGMLGGAFPGFAPAIALAQGFGKPGPDYVPPETWKGATPPSSGFPEDLRAEFFPTVEQRDQAHAAWIERERAKNVHLLQDQDFLHTQNARDELVGSWGYPPWLTGASISRSQDGLTPPYQIDAGVRPGFEHPPIPDRIRGVLVRVFEGAPPFGIVEPIDPMKPIV